MASYRSGFNLKDLAIGFVAGCLGVLVFHQLTVWGLVGRAPWSTWAPTRPFGVPVLLSITFWGGVWGVLFALIAPRLPRGVGFYIAGFVFGAIVPTLAGWYIVPLFKGGAFGPPAVLWRGPVINGAWGLGTAIFMSLLRRVVR